MANELKNIFIFPSSGLEIVTKLGAALVCGLIISWLYRRTYRGPGYSSTFINTLIAISMITAVVIMVIGNNLARAFGLVGTMSLIRFRTAVKNTQDIAYIFFALAIGMAAGIGFYQIAFISTVFIGLVMLMIYKIGFLNPERDEFLLQINSQAQDGKTPGYQAVFDKYCRNYKIINAKTLADTGTLELSFYVRLRDKKKNQDFVSELKKAPGVEFVNLYFDEEVF